VSGHVYEIVARDETGLVDGARCTVRQSIPPNALAGGTVTCPADDSLHLCPVIGISL
jgi:hypothetical protein